MKKSLLLVLLVLALSISTVAGDDDVITLTADLHGVNEVPAINNHDLAMIDPFEMRDLPESLFQRCSQPGCDSYYSVKTGGYLKRSDFPSRSGPTREKEIFANRLLEG